MKVKIFNKIYEVETVVYCEEEKGTYYYLKGKKTPYCDLDYDIEIISDSQELTPLKALERIVNTYFIDNMDKEINIIETALKEHELMKEIRITARFDLAQVNKEHKALEIIKECLVSEFKLFEKDGEYFILFYFDEIHQLTFKLKGKEEYDLLKEVL